MVLGLHSSMSYHIHVQSSRIPKGFAFPLRFDKCYTHEGGNLGPGSLRVEACGHFAGPAPLADEGNWASDLSLVVD